MPTPFHRAWRRRKEPVVFDKRLDVGFAALWLLYAGWGISGAIVNTQFLNVEFGIYPTLWGLGISFFALLSVGAIIATFFTADDSFKERAIQYKMESLTVAVMGSFILVHPVVQVLRLFNEFPPRWDSAFIGLSYLVMVVLRILIQLSRVQHVKEADRRYWQGRL